MGENMISTIIASERDSGQSERNSAVSRYADAHYELHSSRGNFLTFPEISCKLFCESRGQPESNYGKKRAVVVSMAAIVEVLRSIYGAGKLADELTGGN
jgi:hypothetical protein